MSTFRKSSLWGRLNVRKKLVLIPLFFIAALAGILLFTVSTLQRQKSDALVTDLMGRQRMLNQRQMKNILLESLGLRDVGEMQAHGYKVVDFDEIRAIFRQTIDGLLNGGEVVREIGQEGMVAVPAVRDESIRQNLDEQRRLADEFFVQADRFLELQTDDPRYDAELKKLLVMNQKLHEVINPGIIAYTNVASERIATMIQSEIAIGVVVALIGISFSWCVARGVSNPLGTVASLAQKVSEGDLTCESIDSTSTDEVGQLTNTFNTMLGSLKELIGQIRSVTENVNSAATQISSSTKQQSTSTKEQAATIQQISSTMKEISETGGQIIEKAKELTAKSEATAETGNAGLDSVRATNRTMNSIREQVEEVAENIVTLSEKTQAIAEIVSTVNEVAEQSNLLALNATIEAADAGDQGSRFSVVANEMKNLADQAKQCTVQVRSILGDIQKGINGSVMLTEEAVKRVESGRKQAEVSEQAILDMAESMQESVMAFQQIIGATNQQQVGFDQVTQGMQDINAAATQTASGTAQLEQAVSDLSSMSQQLKSAVGRYEV